MVRMCCRDATSGKTPPYFLCSSIWVATTLESRSRPFSTTAAAVSSQELSIPRIRVIFSTWYSLILNLMISEFQLLFDWQHQILGEICQDLEFSVFLCQQ